MKTEFVKNPIVYALLGPLLVLWALDLVDTLRTLLSGLIVAVWLIQIGGIAIGVWLWFLSESGWKEKKERLAFNRRIFSFVPTVELGYRSCVYLTETNSEESK